MCFSVKLHSSTGVNNGAAIKKMDSVEVVVFDFGLEDGPVGVYSCVCFGLLSSHADCGVGMRFDSSYSLGKSEDLREGGKENLILELNGLSCDFVREVQQLSKFAYCNC
nr:hypothetical protein CFP56_15396 [Quercus suber]